VKFARGAEQGGAGVELQGELWGNRVDEETMERTVSACVLEAKVRGGRGQGWGMDEWVKRRGTRRRGPGVNRGRLQHDYLIILNDHLDPRV
jgi:hypothetical protein